MAEQDEHEDTKGVEVQASMGKRKPRLNEAPVQQSQAERSPEWPAQYEGDGWDQVPVQMRPQS